MAFGSPKPWIGDISKLPDDELVKLQLHHNDWFVRRARRVLEERAAAGTLKPETAPALLKMFDENPDIPRKLRALWALHCIGAANEEFLIKLLEAPDDNMRSWAVRLLADNGAPSSAALQKFAKLAKNDPSQMVRLHLASACQKLPTEFNAAAGGVSRAEILKGLLTHAEDAADTNLPLMYWYALEPLIPASPTRAPLLGLRGQIPLVRELTARRATDLNIGAGMDVLTFAVEDAEKAKGDAAMESRPLSILKGIVAGLKGQRDVKAPFAWKNVSAKLETNADAEVRKLTLKLAFIFGDPAAVEKCCAIVVDTKASTKDRETALELLVQAHSEKAAPLLLDLLKEPELRDVAIRGLAVFDDPKSSAAILAIYPTLSLAEKSDALYTLGARPAGAPRAARSTEKQDGREGRFERIYAPVSRKCQRARIGCVDQSQLGRREADAGYAQGLDREIHQAD